MNKRRLARRSALGHPPLEGVIATTFGFWPRPGDTSDLMFAQAVTETGVPTQAWPVLYLPPGSKKPEVGDGPTSLAEAWKEGGLFVFADEIPTDTNAVATWLRSEIFEGPLPRARLAWVGMAGRASEAWSHQELCPYVAPKLTDPSEPDCCSQDGSDFASDAALSLRNYTLDFVGGYRVAICDRFDPETGAVPEIVIEPGKAGHIGFGRVAGPSETGSEASARLGTSRVAVAVAGGERAGCLHFEVQAGAASPTGTAAADPLDVGVRFFYPAATSGRRSVRRANGTEPSAAAAPDSAPDAPLTSLRFPVFEWPRGGVPLTATLDPLRPLDPERCHLAFGSAAPAGGDPLPELASHYRTTLGHTIGLTPRAGASRLVFALAPESLPARGDEALSLVPVGPFDVRASQDGAPIRWMPGLSGTEYVEVESDAPGTLTFVQGRPAYAAGFDPAGRGDPGGDPSGPRLSGLVTTAWPSIASATPLRYYAQPQAASFHGGAPAEGAEPQPRVPYFPVVAGTLPAAGGAETITFPAAPYGDAEGDADTLTAFEKLVLAPTRRGSIPGLPASGEATQTVNALTKGGLVGAFANTGAWSALHLAYRPGTVDVLSRAGLDQGPADADGVAQDGHLSLNDLGGALRRAFLSDPHFIVISDPKCLVGHFDQHTVTLEDWVFDLDPAGWGAHRTIAIVKSFDGKSVRELATDVATWTGAADFNVDPNATRRRLVALLAPSPDADGNDPSLAALQARVRDPHWNGVLFLDVSVPVTELPPQLEGLAAGIDAAFFYAHHLGVDHSRVDHATLALKDSSLFGLINYPPAGSRPEIGSSSAGSYNFRVDLLRVAFADSAITSFASKITLEIRRLFGTPVSSPLGNEMQLTGSLQKRDGRDAYTFATTDAHPFAVKDSVLESVTLEAARYDTLHAPPAGDTPDDLVLSRFTFRGSLSFGVLSRGEGPGQESFDAFSYDTLAFSDLGLRMSFPRRDPTARTFAFDPTHTAFDLSASSPRSGSLADAFPVMPRGIVWSTDADPTALRFKPIQIPMPLARVEPPWFGILCDLDLGTLGSLAADAGFTASLALVWTPSGGADAAFVGLRIPGLGVGVGSFQLEDVINVAIPQMQFGVSETDTGKAAYWLLLKGVGLSLFGLRLPRDRSISLAVFGDPEGHAAANAVGWYGAYGRTKE